jgi:glutathione S-transferase
MITISAFKWVPVFAQGLVRDFRIRWALEESGLPYRTKLIDSSDQKSAGYRALQPFGQVPMYEEDGLVLFESGAIVIHIAQKSDVLMPSDAAGRAQAVSHVFAALNSIEQYVQTYSTLDFFYANEEWARLRRPSAEQQLRARLTLLQDWLGDRDYLSGRFTVGDLMMMSVLRILRGTSLLDDFPGLKAYTERGESRPALKKAVADQLAVFAANDPTKAPVEAREIKRSA